MSIYAAINAVDEFGFVEVIRNCLPFIHSNISLKNKKKQNSHYAMWIEK